MNCKKYFAYGSNMLSRRLIERVPSAIVLSTGYIRGYTLRFNKRSKDESGKGNAVKTDNPEDVVYGVLFEIEEAEQSLLNKYEGLSKGYNIENVEVITADRSFRAFTYLADVAAVDDSLIPYPWYKDLVVEGAKQHFLLPEYIAQLESFESMSDPDSEREARNRKILRV